MDIMSWCIQEVVACLLISSVCSGQLYRQTIYGLRAPSIPAPPPPPMPLYQPPPRRMYPLHGYPPVRNIDIYQSNYNRMYANGMPTNNAMGVDDSWIADAINGYNNDVESTTTESPETTTESPETTTDQPETTTTGEKYPKFYYDDYDELICVDPANAIVIALINLVAVIMIFMGSDIVWVGRRSIGDDRRDTDMFGLTLLNDGLFLGSSVTTGDQCLQRAACEVPQKAELYAQGFDAVIWMKTMFKFIPDTEDHLRKIVEELRRAASSANGGIDCKWNFPCKSLGYLGDDDDAG